MTKNIIKMGCKMKSKAYYLKLSPYIERIYQLAEQNDRSLGETIVILIKIGLANIPKK